MNNDPIVHIWNINCYVKANRRLRKELKNSIRDRYNSFKGTSCHVDISRKRITAICNGEFTNVRNLFQLTNLFDMDNKYVEKNIELFRDSKTSAFNRTYPNIFPLGITPAIIRIVAHVIGDGSVYEHSIKYCQKDVSFLNDLISTIIHSDKFNVSNYERMRGKKTYKYQTMSIPTFFAKAISEYFKISMRDIGSSLFLDKMMKMPRHHRVQAIAALIVDEGNISHKKIEMASKDIVNSLANLMDSLGYERGRIISKRVIKDCFGKHYNVVMHKFFIHANGLKDLLYDIESCVKTQRNRHLDLWQKQKQLEERVIAHNYKKIMSDKHAQEKRNYILELFSEKGAIKADLLSDEIGLKRYQTYYLLKTLLLKKRIKRISHGTYSLNINYNKNHSIH